MLSYKLDNTDPEAIAQCTNECSTIRYKKTRFYLLKDIESDKTEGCELFVTVENRIIHSRHAVRGYLSRQTSRTGKNYRPYVLHDSQAFMQLRIITQTFHIQENNVNTV